MLSEASLEQMITPTRLADGTVTDYGLGAYIEEIDGALSWGHSGSTHGYQARLRFRVSDGAVVATLANNFVSEADVIDEAAWALLAE